MLSHGALDAAAAKNTEDITAEELSVNPQYTIEAAYDQLKNAVYPLTLPFHRPLEVARAYLQHLGSSRYQVMDTFQQSNEPSDVAIACEYLKISHEEYQIMTGKYFNGSDVSPIKPLYEFYGYDADTINGDSWQDHISHVPELLKQTRIRYVDLIELLKTRFLNANQEVTIALIVPESNETELLDLCDLSNL